MSKKQKLQSGPVKEKKVDTGAERQPHRQKHKSSSPVIKSILKYFWKFVGAVKRIYRKVDSKFHFFGERIFDSIIAEMIASAAFIFLYAIVNIFSIDSQSARITSIIFSVTLYLAYLVFNYFSLRYYYRHTRKRSMYYKTNFFVFLIQCAIMFSLATYYRHETYDGIYTILFFPFKWFHLIFENQYGRLRSAVISCIPVLVMIVIIPFITKRKRHKRSTHSTQISDIEKKETAEKSSESKKDTKETNE